LVVNSKNNQAFRAQLITKGRKTGKDHIVWLLAVMYENKVYFSRHRPDGDWFKNALHNPEVKVQFDTSSYFGRAKIVNDEKLAKKISELKYPGEKRAFEKRVVLEITLN
jgi:hypothetical protein